MSMDGDLDGIRDWQEVGVAGESVGLEWGGRWRKIRDMPHFQLTRGLTYEAAATLIAGGRKIPEDYFT
jgi:peptidoglycan L-alanyl-D-glutamate endopeptidase CwlK